VLKEKITGQLIMVLPYFGKKFRVRCNASGVYIGAVLSQDNKPVAYLSEKLNDTKKKYSTYDKEFYVVIQSLKKWRHYLIPKDFVLYSDNQALQFITRK
jgi:sulfur relay (sulfurtransferase) DsrF/TusC family protein